MPQDYINLKPVEFKGLDNSAQKEKSPMRQKLDDFLNFKNSPILKAINSLSSITSDSLKELEYISDLLDEDDGSGDENIILNKALQLENEGVTRAYIRFAERKLLLRNEIASLGSEEINNPVETMYYLYSKYQRFLVDTQVENNIKTRNPKLELILFKLYEQSKLQEKVKNINLSEFVKIYFPSVTKLPADGTSTIEILPLAVHLKTTDKEFLARLNQRKNEISNIPCGGFFTTINDLYIITELDYGNIDVDTKSHELFHAEVKLNNLHFQEQNKNHTDKNNLGEKISLCNTEEDVQGLFEQYFNDFERRISEEVLAFFSEPNHDLGDFEFDFYANVYKVNDSKIERSLIENKKIDHSMLTSLYAQFSNPENLGNIKKKIFQMKESLCIMESKGYPKGWILNSLSCLDEPPKLLKGVNLKALAISLPEYDPDLGLRQQNVINRIYEKNLSKTENLKQKIIFDPELISKIEEYVSRPDFESKTTMGSYYFNLTTITLRKSENLIEDLENMMYGQDLIKVINQHGDSLEVRNIIISKLNELKKAGIAKILAQKKTEQ